MRIVAVLVCLSAGIVLFGGALPAAADTNAQPLPFAQSWTNTGLITTANDWSGVPGIIGYRGDAMVGATGVDPQTVLADGSATPVNVLANQTNPNTLATGGIAEFDTLADPVVALQGSGTARAPHLVLTVNTSGLANVTVAYNLRDVDGSADNAIQAVALQYRVGTSGTYTNVPAGFVGDASSGPSLATLVTPVGAVLPAAAWNQPVVQIRVITTDAVGSDEWIGVDDISVTGAGDAAPSVAATSPASGAVDVPTNANVTITFSEPVNVTDPWYMITCPISGSHAATVSGGPTSFTIDPLLDFAANETCTVSIAAASVSDQDAVDPPDNMAANYTFSVTTAPLPVTGLVLSQIYGGGGNAGAPYSNDFIEIYNRTLAPISLSGLSVQYASATGSSWQVTTLPNVVVQAGQYFLVQEAAGTNAAAALPPPDATGTIPMGATAGKIALANTPSPLTGNCPTGLRVVDFVGYGPAADCFEGSGRAPAPSNTNADLRAGGGCIDTNDNSVDFATGAPTPRNTSSFHFCGDQPPQVDAVSPPNGAANVPVASNLTVTFSEPVDVTGSWYSISCSATGSHTAAVSGGPTSFTLDPDTNFAFSENCTATIIAADVTDQDTNDPPDAMLANFSWSFTTTGPTDLAPSVAATTPANGATGVETAANVQLSFSEPVTVTDPWYSIACSSSGTHTATVSGGPTTYTLDPGTDFANSETCTVTISAARVSDVDADDPPDTMVADYTFSFSTIGPATPIHDIQGASHISPMNGLTVSNVRGIVTARSTSGFWMQDPTPDANDATSEAIFVFTPPGSVVVGDAVRVSARVQEFRPGGASTGNLTTTELSGSVAVAVLSHANPLPPATIAGTGGRIPPNTVIEDDASSGDVETSGTFDPANDGIDFWESLEGMRVQLNYPVAVGPTAPSFGETPVVGDDGANAGIRTARGGVLLRANDGNPERLILDDLMVPVPNANVGDHYLGGVVGVLDYNFGNFFLEVTATPAIVHDGVTRETTATPTATELAVATFNVENLAPSDPQTKFNRLAGLIVNNLKAPDVISVEEVQDNSGATDNGVVAADQTIGKLITAIQAAGGPTYDYRTIEPVNDQDGGQPGGNIRQVFFFRTDRGLSFIDRPGGTSTSSTTVQPGPQLSASPGRIDPGNTAWNSSRKPLAGEFMFHGHHLFVIANHFNSKGGDQPLMGHFQPPERSSEAQRHQQAQIVHDFVAQILAADPNANIVVDGDLNDFEWSETVSILQNGVLHDLFDTLPLSQRYSYEFEGNAQTLDHILLSDGLFNRPITYDVVHVNSEFFDQDSDHEPSVVRLTLNDPPIVSAGGPYTVDEGGSVLVAGTGSDPEGGSLTYAWDLDGNGTFETPGQSVTFSAAALDGPATQTIAVRATDDGGDSTVSSTTVEIRNIAPTATFVAPPTAFAGEPFALALTNPHDPSSEDTAAGFTYAFDCGNGYGAFTSSSSTVCTTTAAGPSNVGGKIRDNDGGTTEYRATVQIQVTAASLCTLTRLYVQKNDGLANSFCVKLEHGSYGAYENEVGAQSGKALTPSQADILTALARSLAG
jgi:predicted extracellular nuclease